MTLVQSHPQTFSLHLLSTCITLPLGLATCPLSLLTAPLLFCYAQQRGSPLLEQNASMPNIMSRELWNSNRQLSFTGLTPSVLFDLAVSRRIFNLLSLSLCALSPLSLSNTLCRGDHQNGSPHPFFAGQSRPS